MLIDVLLDLCIDKFIHVLLGAKATPCVIVCRF